MTGAHMRRLHPTFTNCTPLTDCAQLNCVPCPALMRKQGACSSWPGHISRMGLQAHKAVQVPAHADILTLPKAHHQGQMGPYLAVPKVANLEPRSWVPVCTAGGWCRKSKSMQERAKFKDKNKYSVPASPSRVFSSFRSRWQTPCAEQAKWLSKWFDTA